MENLGEVLIWQFGEFSIPHSRKYWRKLNLALEPKIARILADLNLAVWYGIAIRIYVSRKFG